MELKPTWEEFNSALDRLIEIGLLKEDERGIMISEGTSALNTDTL